MLARVLVIDDQRNLRVTLALMLRSAGYTVDEAAGGAEGVQKTQAASYDLVITDLRIGAESGLDVLRSIKERGSLTEVIIMTGFGTVESAVSAMQLGAHDYLQKPFTEAELLVKVERAVTKRQLLGQVQLCATDFKERFKFENIIGRSEAIRVLLGRILRVAPTDATVLITGDSGTGKELVARAIHANSHRADKPFVPVNCAAITETLLESELFGHARGAFTGAVAARKGLIEEAHGGTFFLDEIAETSVQFQAKLLRLLELHEVRRVGENQAIQVDVRIIAATNQDLREAVRAKQFREDLFYRLNVARFVLPPLCERREDIPVLAAHFLDRYNRRYRKSVRFADNVNDALMLQPFRGNVRELENLVEQGVAFAGSDILGVDDVLPVESLPAKSADGARTLAGIVDDAEREAIESKLRELNGNRERTAEALAISATTLWRKMTRLGVRTDD